MPILLSEESPAISCCCRKNNSARTNGLVDKAPAMSRGVLTSPTDRMAFLAIVPAEHLRRVRALMFILRPAAVCYDVRPSLLIPTRSHLAT